ncbi:TonB-dependent receptor [Xanthovirga aplysinae]|uniref:TonB-dependent receptor n=1 Tax=Xanthovirga aplysinae TaxID=2529853 RepID=UPI0012BBC982|nr:TonB-dependent receptor [Xanthovirga aplysinae]MTI32801.1 TonB-dependent receptor [Xanthovirga aplysinae]
MLNHIKSIFFLMTLVISLDSFGQSGILKGTVKENENGETVIGATVYIKSLSKGDVTGFEGNYILTNIPVGDYEVEVQSVGYQPVKKIITINESAAVIYNFELQAGVLLGESVVVQSQAMSSQASAIKTQKKISQIATIVSNDQLEQFPDMNIGDALKRIPGVTMQMDQGEAEVGMVRGTSPEWSSVTIHGERLPSAEAGSRAVEVDLIPANLIQGIELFKALTPDMDADAIGGVMNLLLREAPYSRNIFGDFQSGINASNGKPLVNGGLGYGNRFLKERLGVIGNISWYHNDLLVDNIEALWDKDEEGNPMVAQQNISTYNVTRERISAALNFEYTFNESNKLYLRNLYTHHNEYRDQYLLIYEPIGQLDENGIVDGRVRRQTVAGAENGQNSRFLEDQRIYFSSLAGEHDFGKLDLHWSLALARASQNNPHSLFMEYTTTSPLSANENSRRPVYTPLETNNNKNFKLHRIWEQNEFTSEEDKNFRLDLRYTFDEKRQLKFGSRYRNKLKIIDNSIYNFIPLVDDYQLLNQVNLYAPQRSQFMPGDQYSLGNFVDHRFLGGLALNNPDIFRMEDDVIDYLTGNLQVREGIWAGYVMYNQQLSDQLSLLTGVRLEATHTSSNGYEVDGEENIRETEAERSYLNVLPHLQFKYIPEEDLIFRLVWSNTLARPQYADLAPYRQINFQTNRIALGNPDLKAANSYNLDFMAEKYFGNAGLLTGGAFYKYITDFIYTNRQSNYLDPVSGELFNQVILPMNGGYAHLYGLEIAFQRDLYFLPGFLKGIGVYANYTYTNSRAYGIPDRGEKISLPGTSKHSLNASLSYDWKNWEFRLSGNYSSAFLDELDEESTMDVYYDQQFFMDFNSTYTLNDHWRIFVSANNLTNQPLRYFQGERNRTFREDWTNRRFNLGAKFNF